MTTRIVSPLSDPAWADLMVGPRGSGFGASPWLRAIFDTYGFDLSARLVVDDADGRVVAGFTQGSRSR